MSAGSSEWYRDGMEGGSLLHSLYLCIGFRESTPFVQRNLFPFIYFDVQVLRFHMGTKRKRKKGTFLEKPGYFLYTDGRTRNREKKFHI